MASTSPLPSIHSGTIQLIMKILLPLMVINSALSCDGINDSIKTMWLVSKEPNLPYNSKSFSLLPCIPLQVSHSLQCAYTNKRAQYFCNQKNIPGNILVLEELLLKCFANSWAHCPLRRTLFKGLLSIHIVPNKAFLKPDTSILSDIFSLYVMNGMKHLPGAM